MPTAFKQTSNGAKCVVVSNSLNNTTSPLTFSVQAGKGSLFPQPGNGYYVTAYNSAIYSDPNDDPNMRIGLCTARSTDSLTVTWGQFSTPINALTGTPDLRLLLVSQLFTDYTTAINALETLMPVGAVVGTTDSQTLTNKVLTAPTITGGVSVDTITASGVINTTTASSLQDNSTALSTIRKETQFDFVASGMVWSGDAYASTRNASMTAGVCYINGRRIAIGAVTARSFTASKDTYVDILDNADGTGTVVYTEATNNAASPALAANSLRVGKIVTGATNIAAAASITQFGKDSLGNWIYNTNSGNKSAPIRIRQGGSATVWDTAGNTNFDLSSTAGIMMQSGAKTGGGNSSSTAVTFPVPFLFAPSVIATPESSAGNTPTWYVVSVTTTGFTFYTGVNVATFNWLAIGV